MIHKSKNGFDGKYLLERVIGKKDLSGSRKPVLPQV